MTEQDEADDPGVEGSVARPGGVSYLAIPARDVARSAAFYQAVFGWELRGDPDHPASATGPATSSATGGPTWSPPGRRGVRRTCTSRTLRRPWSARPAQGAEVVEPYAEGTLRIAVIRDPGG